MTSAGPDRSVWAAVLGPVLTHTAASTLLGVTTLELTRRRESHDVLAIRAGRRWVYPLVQFHQGDVVEPLPGLHEVLDVLIPYVDALGAAQWLATPNRKLRGQIPWEHLIVDEAAVLHAAQAHASVWR